MSTARTPTTNAADISGMQFIRDFQVNASGSIVFSNGTTTVKKYLKRDPLDIAYYKELPYIYWTNGTTNAQTYKSRDAVTWVNVPQTGMPTYPYSYSKIEFFDGAMYKLGSNYVMHKSLDGGSTWTPSVSAFFGTVMVATQDALWDVSVNKYTVDSSTNTWYSNASVLDMNRTGIIYWAEKGKYVACGSKDIDGTIYPTIGINDSPTGTWEYFINYSQSYSSYCALFVANGNLHLIKGVQGYGDTFQTIHIGSSLPVADDFTETAVGSPQQYDNQSAYYYPIAIAHDGVNKGIAMIPVENYDYYGVAMANLFNMSQVIMLDNDDQLSPNPNIYYSSGNQKFHINADWSTSGLQFLEASASDITTWTTETTVPLASKFKMSINNG